MEAYSSSLLRGCQSYQLLVNLQQGSRPRIHLLFVWLQTHHASHMRSAGVGTSEGFCGSSRHSCMPRMPLNTFRLSPVIRAHRVPADSHSRGVPLQTRTSAPGATPRAELTDERLLATALHYSKDTPPKRMPPDSEQITICNSCASSKIFSSTPMVAAEPPDVTVQVNALESKEALVFKQSRSSHSVSFSFPSTAPSNALQLNDAQEQNQQHSREFAEKLVSYRKRSSQ